VSRQRWAAHRPVAFVGHVVGWIAAAALSGATILHYIGVAAAQDIPTAPLYADAGRVDSLRTALGPDRLSELRREAAGDGGLRAWYDLGAALLLSGDWEGAVEPLECVAAGAGDPEIDQSAMYNLGVANGIGARPREGQRADGPQADEMRAGLTKARDAFRRVLRANPEAEDARWNLEVVNRWLERMGGSSGGPSGGGGGAQGDAGERREMTPEEVRRLLEAAASEERRVQEDRFQRSRARDPVAERNW